VLSPDQPAWDDETTPLLPRLFSEVAGSSRATQTDHSTPHSTAPSATAHSSAAAGSVTDAGCNTALSGAAHAPGQRPLAPGQPPASPRAAIVASVLEQLTRDVEAGAHSPGGSGYPVAATVAAAAATAAALASPSRLSSTDYALAHDAPPGPPTPSARGPLRTAPSPPPSAPRDSSSPLLATASLPTVGSGELTQDATSDTAARRGFAEEAATQQNGMRRSPGAAQLKQQALAMKLAAAAPAADAATAAAPFASGAATQSPDAAAGTAPTATAVVVAPAASASVVMGESEARQATPGDADAATPPAVKDAAAAATALEQR